MARIECEIEAVEIENEDTGRTQDGVEATCGECGHTTQSFGDGEGSVRRCLALMREQCPRGENNFYVDADE